MARNELGKAIPDCSEVPFSSQLGLTTSLKPTNPFYGEL